MPKSMYKKGKGKGQKMERYAKRKPMSKMAKIKRKKMEKQEG